MPRHISVPVDNTMEFINFTEISPLVSKCEIKVCYVGENRNATAFTKEALETMGKYLPGSPIVGYYNEENKDFEEHNRALEIKDGKFSIIDTTKAYGFVPTDAKVWFQKFIDDNQNEREYLVTEGILWTEVYPEAKRINDFGNNQSMELNSPSVKGNWAKSVKTNKELFIINEALIEKLCILGEDFEPCFEGSQIQTHFSLKEEFEQLRASMYSMIEELKEALNEGGSNISMEENKNEQLETVEEEVEVVEETTVEEVAEIEENNFAKKDEEEEKKSDNSNEEKIDETEKSTEDENNNKKEDEEDKNKEKKYILEEIPEYIELKNNYSLLEAQYNELKEELEPLKTFKLTAERKEKENMINSFVMLNDEQKEDVVNNIDKYSLDEIEAKLAVVCLRNKINFSLEEETDKGIQTTFSLVEDMIDTADQAPAWVKAVKQVQASKQ